MTDREQFEAWFNTRWPEFKNSRESAFACWKAGREAERERWGRIAKSAAPDLLMALQMLYDETADYIRLNNLGGMDNQCMRLARAALARAKS